MVENEILMGEKGVVKGIENVDKEGYVRIWDEEKRGEWVEERKEKERI